jgi:hypothetical protein
LLDHVKDHPYILITVISAVVFGYGWYATGCTFEGLRDSVVGCFTLITGYITGHSTQNHQNSSDLSQDKGVEDKGIELKYSELSVEDKKVYLNRELSGLKLEKVSLEVQEVELIKEKMQLEKDNKFPTRLEEVKSSLFSIRACLTDHDELVQKTENELYYLDNPKDRPSPCSPVILPADNTGQEVWSLRRTTSSETVTPSNVNTIATTPSKRPSIHTLENFNPYTCDNSPASSDGSDKSIRLQDLRQSNSTNTPTPISPVSPVSVVIPKTTPDIPSTVPLPKSPNLIPASPVSTDVETTSVPSSSGAPDDDTLSTNPLPENIEALKLLYKNASNTFDKTQTLLNTLQLDREISDIAIDNKKAKVLMNRIEDHLKDQSYNIVYIKSDDFVDIRRIDSNSSEPICLVNEGVFVFLLSYLKKPESKVMQIQVPNRYTYISSEEIAQSDLDDMALLRSMDKYEILAKVTYQELIYYQQLFELLNEDIPFEMLEVIIFYQSGKKYI